MSRLFKDTHDAHNQGQTDGATGKYERPVPISIVDEFITSKTTLDRWKELNKAYDEGYNNARKQR